MPNPLVSYQKIRFANILKLIGKLTLAIDAETLHDLRVELKRTRFLKTIIAQYEKKQLVKRAYEPFKKLFKKLGKVRGQQVNLYRLGTTLPDDAESKARQHFQSKHQKLEKKLKKSLKKCEADLQAGITAMNTMIKQLPDWDETEFLKALKRQVAKHFNKKTSEKPLHRGRHVLKAVIYSSELSKRMASKVGSWFNLETVINLEDAIGDWHDLSLLLRGKSGHLLTRKAKKQIIKKKKAELKRIRLLIPDLILSNPTTPDV